MKLIVGLGNPGSQYAKTRHNAGFMVVDALLAKHALGVVPKSRFSGVCVEATVQGERCVLLKPTTFMNRSGQSVAEALRFFKLSAASDMLVIVDELYLPTGVVRLKPGGGTAGHNGLASIDQLLPAEGGAKPDYPRLRVGVGLQPSGDGPGATPGGGKPAAIEQADFVLGRFSPEEEPLLAAAIGRSVEAVEAFASKGLTMAMNLVNAPPAKDRPVKERPVKERPPKPLSQADPQAIPKANPKPAAPSG
jgi:PTH1 family peptidyl-tRNA hydrolase